MKVIVIEDEKPAARRLKRMLQKLDIEVQVMLHSVEESLNWFQTNEEPDLLIFSEEYSLTSIVSPSTGTLWLEVIISSRPMLELF